MDFDRQRNCVAIGILSYEQLAEEFRIQNRHECVDFRCLRIVGDGSCSAHCQFACDQSGSGESGRVLAL